jgi:hypothetical protein
MACASVPALQGRLCLQRRINPPKSLCKVLPCSNDQSEIRVAGLLAGRGDHRVRLAAMMSLVIEEMGNQNAARCAHLASGGYAEPHLVFLQPAVRDACRPVGDARVGLSSGLAQLVENRRPGWRCPLERRNAWPSRQIGTSTSGHPRADGKGSRGSIPKMHRAALIAPGRAIRHGYSDNYNNFIPSKDERTQPRPNPRKAQRP